MVEGARLESVYTCKRIEGSNPSSSAMQSWFKRRSPQEAGHLPSIQIDTSLIAAFFMGVPERLRAENRRISHLSLMPISAVRFRITPSKNEDYFVP